MLAFRSVVSVLVRFVGRSFSTNSRPALRAASGRPPARQPHDGHRATGLTHHPGQNQWLRRRSWLVLAGRRPFLLFPLLLKRQLVPFPSVVSMGAGGGRPIGMAEPVLQLGRLVVQHGRPKMRR
jgi:hypothetical protein